MVVKHFQASLFYVKLHRAPSSQLLFVKSLFSKSISVTCHESENDKLRINAKVAYSVFYRLVKVLNQPVEHLQEDLLHFVL